MDVYDGNEEDLDVIEACFMKGYNEAYNEEEE